MFSRYLSIVLTTALLTALVTVMVVKPGLFRDTGVAKQPQAPQMDELLKMVEAIQQHQKSMERDQRGMFTKLQQLEKKVGAAGDVNANPGEAAKNNRGKRRAKSPPSSPPLKKLTRYDELRAAFKRDSVDKTWSIKAVGQINEAVAKYAAPSSQVVFVECRSKICRLEVNIKNQRQAEKLIEDLSKSLNWANSSMEIYYRDEKQFVVEVFILRNANVI